MPGIKNEIRKKFLEQRFALAEKYQEKIIVRAKELLTSLVIKDERCQVGLYFSTKREISTLSLMNWMNDIGVRYALPRITSYEHKEMAFFLCGHGQSMTRNKFGIYEPEQLHEVEPTVIVVPVVAADTHGNRLGCGHGYYDKYISALRSAGKPLITIGLCHELQIHENVLPVEPHDQPLDYVVTENKIYAGSRAFSKFA